MIGGSGRTCFAADECVAWIQRIGFATAFSLRVDHCLYAGLLLKEAEHKKAQGEFSPWAFLSFVVSCLHPGGAHWCPCLRRAAALNK